MLNNEVKYVAKATERDIVSYIYTCFNDYGWKTSFNYSTFKPKHFFSKSLPITEGCQEEFSHYVDYCFLLSNTFHSGDEASRYTNNQGTGIYFSIVLYWLLVYFGVVNEKGLKFCQGFFSYQRKDGPGYRAGMHAWLSYYGSVIDVTIGGQKDYFSFGEGEHTGIIAGKIPEGMTLAGFEEDNGLAKEYARRFAKDSGLTFHSWVKSHKQQADLLSNSSRRVP